MEYQKCPNCDHEEFAEYAQELTKQEGVKIERVGSINYDAAGTVRQVGDWPVMLFLECESCGSEYILEDGKLVKKEDQEGEESGL
jgi:uncharacterized Zn finger protein